MIGDSAERALLIAGALLLVTGCSVTRHAAISTMTPIVSRTIEIAYQDQDLATVEKGLPANLLLIRGMCESAPGDRGLWAVAAQLYYSYGYAFIEDADPDNAALLYQTGLSIGQKSLARSGWFRPEGDLDSYREGLEHAKPKDAAILFWTLANWVSWINLRQSDPAVLAQLPYAEAALQRLLEIAPTYFEGMPHVMLGTLLSSKPAIAGGKPEEARREFDQGFSLSGRRVLIFQVLYAKYYCRQVQDREAFVRTLQEVIDAPPDLEPRYRLLNEVAKRKAARLMEFKDDWF